MPSKGRLDNVGNRASHRGGISDGELATVENLAPGQAPANLAYRGRLRNSSGHGGDPRRPRLLNAYSGVRYCGAFEPSMGRKIMHYQGK